LRDRPCNGIGGSGKIYIAVVKGDSLSVADMGILSLGKPYVRGEKWRHKAFPRLQILLKFKKSLQEFAQTKASTSHREYEDSRSFTIKLFALHSQSECQKLSNI